MALTKVPSNLDAAISVTQSSGDNSTKVATTSYVDTAISALSDSAPAALNTLNEIAAALGDDANYASTTTAAIAAKLPLSGGIMSGDLTLDVAASPSIVLVGGDGNSKNIHFKKQTGDTEEARIKVYANDMTLDVVGDIILDAGGAEVKLKSNGTQFGDIYTSSNNLYIQSSISNKDLKFEVNNGGTIRTALTLSGASAGAATFNSTVTSTGLLTTNGELQVNGTGSVAVFEATDGPAYIQIKDDDGTSGFIGVDAGKMVFQTPGSSFSSKLVITSTGNVGIGEAAPANLLHVKASDTGIAPHGSAQIVLEREGTNYLQFLTAENGTSGILFGDGSDVDVSKIYVDHNTTKMTFVNEASETMTLNGNKVGIGTVTPDLTLDVTHATAAQYIATFQNTGSNLQLKLGCEAVGYLNIQGARIDNGNPYNLSLQADGSNVGIGITVTDSKLHIKGAASNGIAGLVKIQQTPTHSYSPSSFIGPGRSLDLMTASNSNADSSGIRFANPGGSRETFIGVVQTGGQGDLVIQGYNGSAYGERFRVKADGSIGINNTAPAASISIGTDNAYVQEWEKAKGFKRHDTGVSGANGNYNISTYINVQSYRGLCVDYYESGHYFNNGAAYYFRHSKIYVILEGSTLRVGDVVLVRSTGNRTDAIVNAPSIAVSASGQFTITSTILSGFAHYVSVDVSGSGFISIGAIG